MDTHQNTPAPRVSANFLEDEPRDSFLGDNKSKNQAVEYWRIVRKRWLPACAVAATVLTVVAVATLKEAPTYQSQTVLLVDDSNSMSGQFAAGINGQMPIVQAQKDLTTEIQILKSRALIANSLKSLSDPKLKLPLEVVANRVAIQQVKEAKVLVVSYTDTDPQRVQAILQALGSGYVRYSLDSKRSRATNAIKFIEEQLPQAQQELAQSAKALQEFRKRNGFVDPESYANAVVTNKQALENQAYQAAITLEQTNRQYQELQRQMIQAGLNPQTATTTSILTQDQGYQELVKKLQEIDLKYTQEGLRFQDTHPVMEDLRIQRGKVLNLLQQRAQSVVKTSIPQSELTNGSISLGTSLPQDFTNKLLEVQTNLAVQTAQLYSIRNTQAKVAQDFQLLPPLQQNYVELQRQYQIKSEAVNGFLGKLQELNISKAEETSPWKILEPPYLPTAPIAPNIKLRLLLGLAGSCGLGVLVALLIEWLDPKIKDIDEITAMAGIPLMGTIPRLTQKETAAKVSNETKYQGYKISPFTESIRSIALNLKYLTPNNKGAKILALTSAVPKEGKSTTTFNLGLVLAELGNKVLIVDADLHRPTQHKLLKESQSSATTILLKPEGLSTVLATDCPWKELIKKTNSEYPHIITSGPIPPNPIALLNSQKMTDILHEWRQVYDYVLIDTPPIVGIADAQSLGHQVDGMILVVSMNVPPKKAVNRAVELVKNSGCNIAGLVINRVDQVQNGYYYHYYSSYYSGAGESHNGNGNGSSNGKVHHPEWSRRQ